MITVLLVVAGLAATAAGIGWAVVLLRRLPIVAEDEAWLPEATEETVAEGLAAMREGRDWVTERLEHVVATHHEAGVASGSLLYVGRHRPGVAAGSSAQQSVASALLSPTDAYRFHEIASSVFDTTEMAGLAQLVDEWRCQNCTVGEHPQCPGCTCPCGVQAVAR